MWSIIVELASVGNQMILLHVLLTVGFEGVVVEGSSTLLLVLEVLSYIMDAIQIIKFAFSVFEIILKKTQILPEFIFESSVSLELPLLIKRSLVNI